MTPGPYENGTTPQLLVRRLGGGSCIQFFQEAAAQNRGQICTHALLVLLQQQLERYESLSARAGQSPWQQAMHALATYPQTTAFQRPYSPTRSHPIEPAD